LKNKRIKKEIEKHEKNTLQT
jgi:hypothetical protein